jgi:ubiquinone/menaquinone biosynthesis C-methylase UbiE
MDHFQKIYQNQARDYHQMIASEDVDGNLLPAILKRATLEDARLLDIGSGTGRIPLLSHRLAGRVTALDFSLAMLEESARQRELQVGHWDLVQGDMAKLPFLTSSFDLVFAAWAIGHQRFWFTDNWKSPIENILAEMERVVVPNGTLLILETLGTGQTRPGPPGPELAEYYTWLETQHGYRQDVIQTDYDFPSVEDAVQQTKFFFGDAVVSLIETNLWSRLPEWSGLWWKMAEE